VKVRCADDASALTKHLFGKPWPRAKRRLLNKRCSRYIAQMRYISRFKRDRHDGAPIRAFERSILNEMLTKIRNRETP